MQRTVLILSFLTLLIAVTTSCKDSDKEEDNELSYMEKNARAFSKGFDLSDIRDTKLTTEAKKATSDWTAFLTAKSEVENIKNYSLQKLINNSDNFARAMTSLMDSIPEEFDKAPVQGRINVLVTKTKILNQYTKRNVIDTTSIQQSGQDIYEAFENLKIQLNDIFLNQFQDFDINIDRKQDSIQRAKHNGNGS